MWRWQTGRAGGGATLLPSFCGPGGSSWLAGILDCISAKRSLQTLTSSTGQGPWLCICLGFSGLLGDFFLGGVVVGVLLRADGFQVSWSGPGESSQAWFGARVQDAAVCAIINLHLLTGSGGAAVSACGPRTRDWLREGERGWGPLGHAGPGPISLS